MPPKKILIIDDEPAIQMLYNEEFVDAGYTVASAYNGEEGLAAFTDNPPDLFKLISFSHKKISNKCYGY